MSVMCLSDGSHWPATTAEYQKKKKKKNFIIIFYHQYLQLFIAQIKHKRLLRIS